MRRVRTNKLSLAGGSTRRALTLAEAMISTVIVGVMMTAALACVARTAQFRHITSDQQIAVQLGQQLMSEILAKPYIDPALTSSNTLGPAANEAATGNRSLYNDVDDYNGWIESPCELPDGTDLVNGAGWYRKVTVIFVAPPSLDAPVSTDYGMKRITVEVGRVRVGGSVSNASDRTVVDRLCALVAAGRGM